MTPNYQPVIGFEVHCELATASKMFCPCSADHFGKTPNSQTCPVCLGLPGALPVPNKKAIEWTIKIGLALNCQVAKESKFDRKHYFYPDLPKGYQISQYDQPLCTNGYIDTSFGRIGIERVHLEEDTGKLQHAHLNGQEITLVDFNRSGVPLVEIVTKPDITSREQALEYAKKLKQILMGLGVSDCDMEKGSLRLEANISLGLDLGYKVEVKNVNSFRFIGKSIDYELQRQADLLKKSETPKQETRGWNEKTGTTKPQRSKETAADYRYFPEPDIPPMHIGEQWLADIRASIGELPHQKMDRWVGVHHIRADYAQTIISSSDLEKTLEDLIMLANNDDKLLNKALGLLINKQVEPSVSAGNIINIIQSASKDKITDQVTIDRLVAEAISAVPQAAEQYRQGNDKAIAALIGKVMSLAKGKADGQLVKAAIEKNLRS